MNSKEALDKLFMAVDEELLYEQCGVIFATELTKIVEQDLDRLEQLEKENQELRKAIKSWNENGGKLIREKTKLNKALNILRTYVAVSKRRNEVNGNYDISCIYSFGSYKDITQGNYELLKEVLKNG